MGHPGMKPPHRAFPETMKTAAVAALTTLAMIPSLAEPSGNSLETGQPFPAIVLPALEGGRPASVADYRGRRLVLHVFASW